MNLARLQAALNAVCAGLLALFLLVVCASFINSDSAATVLLAKHLLATRSLVSREWVYVSDSLLLDGGLAADIVGVLVWGASVKAFVFTASMGAAFALASCYSLSRTLGASRIHAFAAGLMVLLGPSFIYLDLVIGLGISVQLGLVMLFVSTFLRYVFRDGRHLALAVALAIPLLMTVSSPKKALVYAALPILCACAPLLLAQRRRDDQSYSIRRLQIVSAGLLIVLIAGYRLHAWVLQGLPMNQDYAKLDVALDASRVLENLQIVWSLILKFSGAGNSAFPFAGPLLVPLVLVLLAIAPLAQGPLREFFSSRQGVAYVFAMAGMGGIAAYLLTYQTIKLHYGIYYLLIPLAPLVAIAAAIASKPVGGVVRSSTRIAMLAMLVLGAANVASLLHRFPKHYTGIGKNQQTTHAGQVAATRWLQKHQLLHGYAGYWDANSITLLSNGSIQVTPVSTPTKGRKLRRLKWLVEEDRVNFVPGHEKWFIAIPSRRRAVILSDACEPADSEVTVGGYRIYVFERSVPACIPPLVRLQ